MSSNMIPGTLLKLKCVPPPPGSVRYGSDYVNLITVGYVDLSKEQFEKRCQLAGLDIPTGVVVTFVRTEQSAITFELRHIISLPTHLPITIGWVYDNEIERL